MFVHYREGSLTNESTARFRESCCRQGMVWTESRRNQPGDQRKASAGRLATDSVRYVDRIQEAIQFVLTA